jgi:hypothetical protein
MSFHRTWGIWVSQFSVITYKGWVGFWTARGPEGYTTASSPEEAVRIAKIITAACPAAKVSKPRRRWFKSEYRVQIWTE